PPGAGERAERPLLDGTGQVAVAGQSGGHHELAPAGAPGDRGLAPVALQRVRRGELRRVIADLTGDPGGETGTEARKAQVDLAVRDRLPRLVAPRGRQGGQQLAHPPFPGPALGPDRSEERRVGKEGRARWGASH